MNTKLHAVTDADARPIRDQPFCLWQAAQQGRSAGVVADLARSHEEPQGTAPGIGDCVQLGVQSAFCLPYQTTALVIAPPF